MGLEAMWEPGSRCGNTTLPDSKQAKFVETGNKQAVSFAAGTVAQLELRRELRKVQGSVALSIILRETAPATLSGPNLLNMLQWSRGARTPSRPVSRPEVANRFGAGGQHYDLRSRGPLVDELSWARRVQDSLP